MTMPLALASPRVPGLRRIARMTGIIVLAAFVLAAILHDAIAPQARGAMVAAAELVPPSDAHPFGTDQLGRDVLSESVHALSVTMGDAGIGFAVALLFGTLFGLMAAHLLGGLGTALRLAAGVVASIPVLLLAILFAVLTGYVSAAFAAGLAAAPAQFVRSFDRTRALLSGRQADYARASGITPVALLKRDLSHTLAGSLVALAARAFAAVTITIATMSFFGFGAKPPARDLGLMIASARDVLDTGWWAAAFPAVVLALLVLAAHLAAGISDEHRP